MAMHETVDASFVHDLLDEMGVTSTACGGEGDAEVRLNAYERIRQAKRRLAADRAERARPIDADLPKRIGDLPLDEWCDYWRDGDQSYRDALSIEDIRGDVIAAAALVRKLLRALKGGA